MTKRKPKPRATLQHRTHEEIQALATYAEWEGREHLAKLYGRAADWLQAQEKAGASGPLDRVWKDLQRTP